MSQIPSLPRFLLIAFLVHSTYVGSGEEVSGKLHTFVQSRGQVEEGAQSHVSEVNVISALAFKKGDPPCKKSRVWQKQKALVRHKASRPSAGETGPHHHGSICSGSSQMLQRPKQVATPESPQNQQRDVNLTDTQSSFKNI